MKFSPRPPVSPLCLFAACLIIFFAAPASAAEEGEKPAPAASEVLRGTVRAMERAAAAGPIELKTVSARFAFRVDIGHDNLSFVRNNLSPLLKRDISRRFDGTGSFVASRQVVKSTRRGEPDRETNSLFLEVSSNQLSFALMRRDDDFTFYSPQLNVVLRDSFRKVVEEIERNRRILPPAWPSGDILPAAGAGDFAERLLDLSGRLREVADRPEMDTPVARTSFAGRENYRFEFPWDGGARAVLQVYAGSGLPSVAWVHGPAGETTATFIFPRFDPNEMLSYKAFLPDQVSFAGIRDGGAFDFSMERIRYNQPAPADDFTLRELDMSEFLPFLFFRAMMSRED